VSSSSAPPSGRPLPGEYAAYAAEDIARVEGDDLCAALARQRGWTEGLVARCGERGGGIRYAPGKWSVRQVLGHLADDERIFAYRALCLARGDDRDLPGFDEERYMAGAAFDEMSIESLLDDYRAVRAASITLFAGLRGAAWLRSGLVNGYRATPRGLGFHIAGHELRHLRILEERYLPLLGPAGP